MFMERGLRGGMLLECGWLVYTDNTKTKQIDVWDWDEGNCSSSRI